MNKLLFYAIILFVSLGACKSKKENPKSEETPTCITKAIEVFSKSECKTGLSVKEYTFQGKQVFLFDQSMCGADMSSEVLDSSCKKLGYIGGFTGNTKISGEDFSNAVFVKTHWER